MNSFKPNVLVVCGRNKRRSRTAEYIFKNDMRFNIRSVGLSKKSERQIKVNDIEWSDIIYVMEDEQKARIKDNYKTLNIPVIEVLDIEDIYNYLDEELITTLQYKIKDSLNNIFNI